MSQSVQQFSCSRQFALPITDAKSKNPFDSRVRVEADKPRHRSLLRCAKRAGRRPHVGNSWREVFYLTSSRTVIIAPAEPFKDAPHRRIEKRATKTWQVDKQTDLLKETPRSYCTNGVKCCEKRHVTASGFRLVKMCLRFSKNAIRLVPKQRDSSKTTKTCIRFVVSAAGLNPSNIASSHTL
jgi:hypothetical protein